MCVYQKLRKHKHYFQQKSYCVALLILLQFTYVKFGFYLLDLDEILVGFSEASYKTLPFRS